MELFGRRDLQDRLERLGKLPLEDALEISKQVGSALQAAHQRVSSTATRRATSSCRSRGRRKIVEIAKVIDFGVSKIPCGSPIVRPHDLLVLGIASYMAPEGAMEETRRSMADLIRGR